MPKHLTEAQKARAIELYNSGLTQAKVGERLGVTQAAISALLRRSGITTWPRRRDPSVPPPVRERSLTPVQDAEVAALYESGWHRHQIAGHFGVSQSTVGRSLGRLGIAIRSNRELRTRHSLRHGALDALTSDALYWCGFIFADGSVLSKPGGQGDLVQVHLSECDRGHLVKLRSFLGSTHAITSTSAKKLVGRTGKEYMSRPTCTLSVSSDPLAERLRGLGRYSDPIDEHLIGSRDFWRGAVDGDGSISAGGNEKARFELISTRRPMMEAFLGFLHSAGAAGGMSVRERRTAKGVPIYRVATMGRFAVRVIDLLYRDASTALDRKALRASAILAQTG